MAPQASHPPYESTATVAMDAEHVYEEAKYWLRLCGCTVEEESPPTRIKARYGERHQITWGLMDNNPKTLEVQIRGGGGRTELHISVAQVYPQLKDAGYVYWGTMIEELYRTLHVDVDQAVLAGLYPPGLVRRTATGRLAKWGLILAAVTIALYLVPSFESLERALSVFAVVLLIAVMDSWDYLKLLNRTAASKTAR
jgi:hypothetical protein